MLEIDEFLQHVHVGDRCSHEVAGRPMATRRRDPQERPASPYEAVAPRRPRAPEAYPPRHLSAAPARSRALPAANAPR